MIKNTTCRECGKPMNGGVYRQANKCPHCLHIQNDSNDSKGKPLLNTNVIELEVPLPEQSQPPRDLSLDEEAEQPSLTLVEPSADVSESQTLVPEVKKQSKKNKPKQKQPSKLSSFVGEVKKRIAKPEIAKPQTEIAEIALDEPVVLESQLEEQPETQNEFLATGLTAKDDFIVEEIGLSAIAQQGETIEIPEEIKQRVNDKSRYNARRITPISSPKTPESKPKPTSITQSERISEENDAILSLKAELTVLQERKQEMAKALEDECKALDAAKVERELALQIKAEAEEVAQTEYSRAERIRKETETASIAADHAKAQLEAAKAKMAELECEYETLVMLGAEMHDEDTSLATKTKKVTTPERASDEYEQVLLTAETSADLVVKKRLGLVSAECIVNMDAIQGYVASNNDLSLRQNRNAPNLIEESRKTVLDKLKQEAFSAGGNTVLNVKVDFNPLSSQDQSLLMVLASGTAATAEV